jgi:hypothetical protein
MRVSVRSMVVVLGTLLVMPVRGLAGGDVDGNGRLDEGDAEAILASVVGQRVLTAAQQSRADADGDGDVDVADAQRVRQVLHGDAADPAPAEAPSRGKLER